MNTVTTPIANDPVDTRSAPKRVLAKVSAPGRHWVGDGFPVHGMFGYNGPGVAERSPFLMLDYAAPTTFSPHSGHRRGVGQHPHRGFETVTIVYDGEVEHRDSTGAGGVIGRGDVQWMTAGGGILHEEFHSEAYSRSGGPFEMVQLWVNLPARDKMTPAHYQGITDAQIPSVALPADAGRVRVIAGEHGGQRGPAETYTPMHVWDVRLNAGATADLAQPEGWSTLVVVLDGTVMVNGTEVLRAAEMATLSTEGSGLTVEANGNAKLLVLAGEPIDEPVVGYGPFVMNSQAQIAEAITDFNSGRFGGLHGA
ncbi:pirin family protein [Ottowia sp. GY511]|uniref:Pirin family protein n=1 Tax=Ottowia flava TaxID=2675430 RepID=A0ABW4KW36_9BURK|nr:pirin family protein [Ottowia sp. GY511]TXK31179.1 pirin family protein [Ottowia sp. GY511]